MLIRAFHCEICCDQGVKTEQERMAVGHATAWYIAWRVHDASAIVLRPTCVPAEFGIAGAVLLLAAVAGLLPAVQVYRQDVASNL
jgi:hypothetical protein